MIYFASLHSCNEPLFVKSQTSWCPKTIIRSREMSDLIFLARVFVSKLEICPWSKDFSGVFWTESGQMQAAGRVWLYAIQMYNAFILNIWNKSSTFSVMTCTSTTDSGQIPASLRLLVFSSASPFQMTFNGIPSLLGIWCKMSWTNPSLGTDTQWVPSGFR